MDSAKRSASLATQADGYYRRGLCKYAQKHYNDAIKDFKAAKSKEDALDEMRLLADRNWGIQDGLGRAHHALGDYHRAIEHYELAIEKDATNTEFLSHRAQCYYDQKMFDLSI